MNTCATKTDCEICPLLVGQTTADNWECLMNNAVKAGQSTHVHWHLYPRYLGGATFAGEEFPDPKWPRHLEDAVHMVGDETFREIMQALRSRLAGD